MSLPGQAPTCLPAVLSILAPSMPYGKHGGLGSYMLEMAPLHKRKGAWVPESSLGGEPSAEPRLLFNRYVKRNTFILGLSYYV